MKIYFEDGELLHYTRVPMQVDWAVQANLGVSQNLSMLDLIAEHNPDATVYTNSILALNNKYCWNKELKVPELYIRAGEHMVFTRVDKLTTRELRQGHNLMKLYMNGEFGN